MDTCVCCGEVIPEGRMVCWACENGQGGYDIICLKPKITI